VTMSAPTEQLRALRPFARLDADALASLAACLRPRRFARGDIVLRHGEAGDVMFIIARGALSVQLRGSDRRHREVATLGPGDVVGEMACVDPAPRAATVLATAETEAFALTRDTLGALLAHAPEAAQAVLQALLHALLARVHEADARLVARIGEAAPTRSGVVPRVDAVVDEDARAAPLRRTS